MPRRVLSETEFERIKAEILARAPANLSEAEFTRWVGPVFAAEIARAEHSPPPQTIGRFFSNLGEAVNLVTIATNLYKAVETPAATTQTLRHIGAASAAEWEKAKEHFAQGRYSEAIGHAAAVTPLIGPAAAAVGEQIGSGDVAGGLGQATGLLGLTVAPGAVARRLPASIPLVPRVGAPAARELGEFGLREGIAVDPATATGNPFLRGIQRLSEESILGSTLVSPTARATQAETLTAAGERLAGRTSPAPVTAEQAGQAVRETVTARAAAYDAAADVSYGKLRAIEARQAQRIAQSGGVHAPATAAQPFTNIPLAVDLAPTKAAMQPIYQALKREAELVPLMGDKGRALTSLDRLMSAPDLAPLSIADSALGDLKSLARVDQTFRRTAGQGIAAEAVGNLDQAVRATAMRAGPDAMRALMDGRAATVNKFKTITILDQLRAEPRAVFNQATMRKDAGIAQLRQLARVAPDELRQVGRAWLEDALTKATAEGGFGRAQGLLAEWENLGPHTKHLLFGNPAHVKDLDNFFRLAKRMTENPNPSGSALTIFKGAELGALGREVFMLAPGLGVGYTLTAPFVAKALLSPTTTRLLLQGLRLPISARTARAAWAGQLGRALDALDAPVPALTPAVVQADESRRRRRGEGVEQPCAEQQQGQDQAAPPIGGGHPDDAVVAVSRCAGHRGATRNRVRCCQA